jgi:hypothetical protein
LLLEILAIAILILFALLAAVLLIPVDFTVEASKAETSMMSRIVVRWLGITVWRSRAGKRKAEPKPRPKEFDLARVLLILTLLRDAAPSLVRIFRSFGRAARLRRLSIDVSFGVGDPAETAILAGYLWSIAWALDLVPRASLSLHPDLERARLDGSISAELGVRLLPIAVDFLVAFTKKPFRRLLREARR